MWHDITLNVYSVFLSVSERVNIRFGIRWQEDSLQMKFSWGFRLVCLILKLQYFLSTRQSMYMRTCQRFPLMISVWLPQGNLVSKEIKNSFINEFNLLILINLFRLTLVDETIAIDLSSGQFACALVRCWMTEWLAYLLTYLLKINEGLWPQKQPQIKSVGDSNSS